MIHLTNAATAMVDEWRRNGFNGVRFHKCEMETNPREEDEQSEQQYQDFIRDYAIFIADPDLEPHWHDRLDPYHSHTVHHDEFIDDLCDEIAKHCGTGVTISHQPHCHEFEVVRRHSISLVPRGQVKP